MPAPCGCAAPPEPQTRSCMRLSSRIEKPGGRFGRLRQRHARNRNTVRKCRKQARWKTTIEHDKDAAVTAKADQPAISLPQAQPGDLLAIVSAAEDRSAGAVQNVRARPGNTIKDEQAQRAARDIDA